MASAHSAFPDPPSTFSLESSLSEELLKLSFGQRNELEEEIHGVRCRAPEESPELLARSLREFDERINTIKETTADPGTARLLRNIRRVGCSRQEEPTNACFEEKKEVEPMAHSSSLANENSPFRNNDACYLNDPDVRLRFLRCECFAVEPAVQRLLVFLELMSELFGSFVADRPVRRSDFSLEEDKALRKSRSQILPYRDRSGRRVLVTLGHANYHVPPRTRYKILMYLYWVISSDAETQRKGLVAHTYVFDEDHNGDAWEKVIRPNLGNRYGDKQHQTFDGRPIRMVANHVYYQDTPFFRMLAALYVQVSEPKQRKITKVHFGGQTEVFYKMASQGVSVDVLPITSSGTLKFTNHCTWLKGVEWLESTSSAGDEQRELVECPASNDVIFRSGKTGRYNPGNSYYRDLIIAHSADHTAGDKKQKQAITTVVLNAIVHERRGRFLESDGGIWVVVQDPDVARRKIGSAFKQYKRTNRERLVLPMPRKLDETIDLATTLVRHHTNPASGDETASALQAYYSLQHPSKRLKTSSCFARDNDCFGRNIFPVGGGPKISTNTG